MQERAIRSFLLSLGIDGDTIKKTDPIWLQAPCPMAPWTHGGGVDERPSFYVRINEEGPSSFHCFGCCPDPRYLIGLLHNIFIMSEYPWEAAQIYLKYEIQKDTEVDEKALYEDKHLDCEPMEPPDTLPRKVLIRYPLLQSIRSSNSEQCVSYLAGRGIPRWVQNYCRVRYSPQGPTLIFPLTDKDWSVYLLRARSIHKKSMWTINPKLAEAPELTFAKLSQIGIWFNMGNIRWDRPLWLVEGEIDAMRLIRLGQFNVIASATSSVTRAQIEALHASTLYLAYDADKGGKRAHERIQDFVGSKASMWKADWSKVKKADGEPCKDAGDVTGRDDLQYVIDSMKEVGI